MTLSQNSGTGSFCKKHAVQRHTADILLTLARIHFLALSSTLSTIGEGSWLMSTICALWNLRSMSHRFVALHGLLRLPMIVPVPNKSYSVQASFAF
jgi:hypothetical protein